jgi:hypothetical protein
MIKFVHKHISLLLFLICLAAGIIRARSIHALQAGHYTMLGTFTFFSYVMAGICLAITSGLIKLIDHTKISNIMKIVISIVILIIGLFICCLLLSQFH